MIDNKYCTLCGRGTMVWLGNYWECRQCGTLEFWADNSVDTGQAVILESKIGVTVRRVRVEYIGRTTDGRTIITRQGGGLELVQTDDIFPDPDNE